MTFQFDVSFTTRDVDAVVESEHGGLMDPIHEVGRGRGWKPIWPNESVNVYLSPQAKDQRTAYGVFPSEARVGLRVYVDKPEYLLAMKLRALRGGSRDAEDALTLARFLGLRTEEELVAAVEANFPNEPIDGRKRALPAEMARSLA